MQAADVRNCTELSTATRWPTQFVAECRMARLNVIRSCGNMKLHKVFLFFNILDIVYKVVQSVDGHSQGELFKLFMGMRQMRRFTAGDGEGGLSLLPLRTTAVSYWCFL